MRNWILMFGVLALLTGCGKVVQDVGKSTDLSTVDFRYQVAVVPTVPVKSGRGVSDNVRAFAYSDATVYAQVSGIDASGKSQELSWGRASVVAEFVSVSGNRQKRYRSVPYRKDGVVLSGASDATWTRLTLDPAAKLWRGESNKIKKGYPFYLVSVWVSDSVYAMKIVDAKTASQNKVVALESITPYETFVSTLFLMMVRQDPGVVDRPERLGQLRKLVSPAFFGALSYRRPVNLPEFVFSGEMEKQLLDVLQLALADPKGAARWVSESKATWMTADARRVLLDAIRGF